MVRRLTIPPAGSLPSRKIFMHPLCLEKTYRIYYFKHRIHEIKIYGYYDRPPLNRFHCVQCQPPAPSMIISNSVYAIKLKKYRSYLIMHYKIWCYFIYLKKILMIYYPTNSSTEFLVHCGLFGAWYVLIAVHWSQWTHLNKLLHVVYFANELWKALIDREDY